MFIDARSVRRDSTLSADVCIVGAGPAGISIALELLASDLRVLLLESGGLGFDAASQELAQGELSGRDYYPLVATRRRGFGGSSALWAGQCIVPDPSDFEARDWLPESGWPFPRSEIEPFYPRAAELCQLDELAAEPRPDEAPLPLGGDRVHSRVIQFSPPTRFGPVYAPRIRRASRLRALLFANATRLEPDADLRRVERVQVACLDGNRFGVRARTVVLAAGGIENARLLLASRDRIQRGLGNPHDWVGRTFMEHVLVWSGVLLPSTPRQPFAFYDRRGRRRGYLAVREELRQREGLLNAGMTPLPLSAPTLHRPAREAPDPLRSDLAQALPGLDRGLPGPAASARVLWSFLEQAPVRGSRIALADSRDALGEPRAHLHWTLGGLERPSLQRSHEILAHELGRAAAGRLRLVVGEARDEGWRIARGGHHHMGTTRMSSDPRRGVVDADARVHGLANLFVAGSSVFPTSGCANPTLTLVALAVRLARHLRREALS